MHRRTRISHVADKFQDRVCIGVLLYRAVGREFLERMGQTQSSPQGAWIENSGEEVFRGVQGRSPELLKEPRITFSKFLDAVSI